MRQVPRFPVGLQFVYHADKQKRLRTIVDILTTTNSRGEVVEIEYVTAHKLSSQDVRGRFNDTGIARSLTEEQLKQFADPQEASE